MSTALGASREDSCLDTRARLCLHTFAGRRRRPGLQLRGEPVPELGHLSRLVLLCNSSMREWTSAPAKLSISRRYSATRQNPERQRLASASNNTCRL